MASTEIHPSRWRAGRGGIAPTLIVVHDSEGPYSSTAAANLKRWMATDTSALGNYASYHAISDHSTLVDAVSPADTAFGAGGVNQRALHWCICGAAAAGKPNSIPYPEYLDTPGGRLGVLRTARWCLDYGIPPILLTPEQVRDGAKGICGHGDVSRYHPSSGGHTDPGSRYPWPAFIARVAYLVSLDQPAPAPPPTPAPATGGCTIQVVAGDSWWAIARRAYGRSAVTAAEVQAIIAANGNKPLRTGEYVAIPGHHEAA